MQLTPRSVAFLASLEGFALETYLDSGGVWTWALGVTDSSGHGVQRYKDHPSTVEEALQVSVWLLKEKYLPAVLGAFPDGLNEAQLAAALSFHWNTGAISRADWVSSFNQHHAPESYNGWMSWGGHGLLTGRRMVERALFTNGSWPSDLRASQYPVLKPSYHPDFRHASRVDLMPALTRVMQT